MAAVEQKIVAALPFLILQRTYIRTIMYSGFK